MTLINAAALLFDMDGVLIDSTPAVSRVWAAWALEHGFDPVETAKRAQGRPSITTVRELLPGSDAEAENRLIEQREMDDLEGVIALPGTRELLSALPADRWAIVTSSTRPLAEIRVRTAGLPRPGIFITSTDVTHGKPHPEPYLNAAIALGVSPTECIVLEDAPAGIRAGKAAGARVIAFRTTLPDADLQPARPDWIVNNCSAVKLLSTGTPLQLELQG